MQELFISGKKAVLSSDVVLSAELKTDEISDQPKLLFTYPLTLDNCEQNNLIFNENNLPYSSLNLFLLTGREAVLNIDGRYQIEGTILVTKWTQSAISCTFISKELSFWQHLATIKDIIPFEEADWFNVHVGRITNQLYQRDLPFISVFDLFNKIFQQIGVAVNWFLTPAQQTTIQQAYVLLNNKGFKYKEMGYITCPTTKTEGEIIQHNRVPTYYNLIYSTGQTNNMPNSYLMPNGSFMAIPVTQGKRYRVTISYKIRAIHSAAGYSTLNYAEFIASIGGALSPSQTLSIGIATDIDGHAESKTIYFDAASNVLQFKYGVTISGVNFDIRHLDADVTIEVAEAIPVFFLPKPFDNVLDFVKELIKIFNLIVYRQDDNSIRITNTTYIKGLTSSAIDITNKITSDYTELNYFNTLDNTEVQMFAFKEEQINIMLSTVQTYHNKARISGLGTKERILVDSKFSSGWDLETSAGVIKALCEVYETNEIGQIKPYMLHGDRETSDKGYLCRLVGNELWHYNAGQLVSDWWGDYEPSSYARKLKTTVLIDSLPSVDYLINAFYIAYYGRFYMMTQINKFTSTAEPVEVTFEEI